MNPETVSEKIKLEGGPRHGTKVKRPASQHSTIFEPVTGFVRIDGAPTDQPITGLAVYQSFEEHDCAFWAHNEWTKSNN